MLETISTSILEAAGAQAIQVLADAVRRENAEIVKRGQKARAQFAVAAHLTRDALVRHMSHIREWSSTASFADLGQRKSISQIYVEVDTYLLPLSRHASVSERRNVRPLLSALSDIREHTIILGGVGAGKTTALKKVCLDYFSKGKALLNFNFPLLIQLRELSDSTSQHPLYDKLQEILAAHVLFPNDKGNNIPPVLQSGLVRHVITAYLDSLGALILLDGYDEISDAVVKIAVARDFEFLAKGLRRSRVILTSRSTDFKYAEGGAQRYEIAPLTPDQIGEFALRWLSSSVEAERFMGKVKSSPFYDTTIRPLTIAHLCAIYERTKDIPDKPKSVYRRIVNLLLKEWDEQRHIKRVSKYASFDVDRKLEFLAHMAFLLTTESRRLSFDSNDLNRVYRTIHTEHGLPERQADAVVEEIESHNGLVLRGGYDHYEFAHKSLREFLAADYIVRLPSLASLETALQVLPDEMAIATALSSKPGQYLCALMSQVRARNGIDTAWYTTYATRLVLEKADLTIGHTAFTTVSVLQLITYCADQERERLSELLRNMIPMDALVLLARFYRVASRSDGLVTLLRLPAHLRHELPKELVAPEGLFYSRTDV